MVPSVGLQIPIVRGDINNVNDEIKKIQVSLEKLCGAKEVNKGTDA